MANLPCLHDLPVVASWFAGRSAAGDFHDPQLIRLHMPIAHSLIDIFLNARYGYDMRCEVVCDVGTAAWSTVTDTERPRRRPARDNAERDSG
jgi:myo-inositol 2-dehydrogenase / D-chiro-inositol 1-dehydrogenase